MRTEPGRGATRWLSLAAALTLTAPGPTGAAADAPPPVQPTFLTATQELQLFPKDAYAAAGWRMNNWGKVQKVELAFPPETTPTGLPAIEMRFLTPEGKCNVISPTLTPDGAWRQQPFAAVSFWVKGDGGGRQAHLYVQTQGKPSYVWSFRLDSPEWKKVTLPIEGAFTRDGDGTDLNNIQYCMFNAAEVVSFLAGDIRLEPRNQELTAQSCPSLVVPLIPDAAVALDGALDEPVWQRAAKAPPFVLLASGAEPKERTEVLLFADNENLYLGARLFDEDTAGLIAKQKDRDAQVWQDDCIEILINDNLDAKTYKHFVLNSTGAVQDYRYFLSPVADTFTYDHAWNPDWRRASKIQPKEWTIEVCLPLAIIELRPGEPFAIQIGRENHSGNEISSLTKTSRFPDSANFALSLIGDTGATLSQLALRMTDPKALTLQAQAAPAGALELTLTLADPYGKVERASLTTETDATGRVAIPVTISTPVEGRYRLVVSGRANGTPLAPAGVAFGLVLPPEIQFGDIFLNPRPKQMELKPERFAFDAKAVIGIPKDCSERTRTTARHLRDELYELMGMQLPIVQAPAEACFILALRDQAPSLDQATADAVAKLPAEGYFAEVTEKGVTLIGADEPGLYYACVTFLQLFRANLIRKHEPALGCARILDWPDRPMRIVVHWLHGRWRPKEPCYSLDTLKRWVKDVLAGSKYNYWSPMFNELFAYDDEARMTPGGSTRYFMTRDEYGELVRFAREHFVEAVPAFQSGGHSHHLVIPHPEFQEPGYSHDQANVLHPDYYKTLFSIYQDLLDATPGAKYFHIWHDEWWHQAKTAIADEFEGKKRWEIYRDDLLKIHEFFRQRGVKVMMFGDMISSLHNGGYPFHVAKAIDDLPRDVVICNWSAKTFPGSTKEFTDKGFTVLDVFNQFSAPAAADLPLIRGFGTIAYGHFLQTFGYADDADYPGYAHAIPRAADYAWNLEHDPQLPLGEWRRRYLNNVNALYSFTPRRAKAITFKPVDLAAFANLSTREWFGDPAVAPALPRGDTEIAFIPMTFAPAEGQDVVAALPGQPAPRADLGGRTVKSLIFLQGVFLPKDKRAALKKRGTEYVHGIPIGEAQIEYVDGPTQVMELRMGINTLDVTPFPEARFLGEARYTHDIKTNGGANASLYQIEWVNPWPARQVRAVIWKAYETEATPILFALTAGE
ncbi:MAG: hypothetical protein A3K19_06805 [Lentisphaerae bacterium RIFOXYB12_FULL_65_16]|nr:MAG: hypothetical protein A3K18_21965 [Lentisphaerae bacterium RIFOXYA12_64_32]OGV93159.1 MAG: hypothetical protein A3K19_06805 [Lentisphaerae bacterium RIFOXYB12_FULL_65_16]